MNNNSQIILRQLDKFKRKEELSLTEKMSIFAHVYNLSEEEKPNTMRGILDIILYEYGEFTTSDEYNKQTFLSIYGEPKNKLILMTTIEEVLDIVLGELSMRQDITPIFPSEGNNILTPYTKENSVEFLAMKKLNIYSSTSFDINRLINNKAHKDFPMTIDSFEDLGWVDEFEKASRVVLDLMKQAYNNSHQKYAKIFIDWFNSHFWNEDFAPFEFENDKLLFNSVFKPFQNHVEVKLTITVSHLNLSNNQTITIFGGRELSKIGQQYIKSLYPLNTLPKDKIIFG